MKILRGLMGWIFLFLTITCFAQKDLDSKPSWQSRFYKGGGGGFSGGSNGIGKFFSVSVSPVVGYMLSPQASIGTGVIYQKTQYTDINLSYSMWGVTPFIRYNFNNLFLISQYNYLNLPSYAFNGGTERVFRSRMLFGGGYTVPVSNRLRLNAVAMYDVLYRSGNGFASPWVFQVFFTF